MQLHPNKLPAFCLWTIIWMTFAFGKKINLGALMDTEEHRQFFLHAVQESNATSIMQLNATALIIHTNPVRTAIDICDQLLKMPIHALIINHPQLEYQLASAAASYTMGFYHIPILGISSRESTFSDKNIHRTFIRAIPPYFHQADVWIQLLLTLDWKNVVLITSANRNGRTLLGRFQNQVDQHDITIERAIEYDSLSGNITGDLPRHMENLQSRVFLLYADRKDAEMIFDAGAKLHLFDAGHVWIINEQALAANNCPFGVVATRLTHRANVKDYIRDVITILSQAASVAYSEKQMTNPPNSCDDSSASWSDGNFFYKTIVNQRLANGKTGQVSFDESGDRRSAEYEIVNVQLGGYNAVVGTCKVLHPASSSSDQLQFTLDKRKIIWPGGMRDVPKGYMLGTHLKVVTLHEPPFTHVESVNTSLACQQVFQGFLCYDKRSNASALGTSKNSSSSKTWSGIISELVEGDGDMAIAAITITPEHAKNVDFSKPFKYLGITILEKKQPKTSTLNSFFQPFTDQLWVLVMVSLHVVAVCLYLLDRFSPFSRYKLADKEEPEDDALNLSSAMWFAWGVLLNSGIGEGTPRSFGGRVLGMVWAGFAMIMVASYTANLAAFLVLDRPQTSLSGVNDARLRNPSENFTFATVRGSAVDLYFRRQIELATMYRLMEKRNYDNSNQAVAAVKSGELQAFIWDSARLEYEAARDKDCELVTAGELFGRSGYGVALRKDSPWTAKVTLAILGFHENGFMESLDNKYIYMRNETQCLADESAPATLGLNNMAGVFILVGMGIAGGIILIIIEISYKRHEVKKQRELKLQRMAFDRWKRTVDRRKKSRQRLMKLNRGTTTIGSMDILSGPNDANQPESIAIREKLL